MKTKTYDSLKRGADICLSAVGLIATAPLQAGIAALVRATLGTPVLFRQKRPGKNGKLFTLIKFRTMREPDQERGLVSDADRLTSIGQFLRATSLDELPSLWNVLRGDMSIVGPRPLLPQYLALYTPRQATRHAVRPGLTGLAQVSGRNELDWEERLELDASYVERRSMSLDFYVLYRTVSAVLSRRGISSPGHATMPAFSGSPAPRDQRPVQE